MSGIRCTCAVLIVRCFLQAVHFAAQYGQTAFLNHIVVKYYADFDAPDNEGRSPLHWYAIKLGFLCMETENSTSFLIWTQ